MAYECIIGVDEAGRGPLAGPLVVVALKGSNELSKLAVKDSKKLPAKKRNELYEVLVANFEYAVHIVEVAMIDDINIYQATKLGMAAVIRKLNPQFEITTIVDGNMHPLAHDNIRAVVKADDKYAEVSAASIIAKVTRDRLMLELHAQYPQYAWNENFGYATKKHYEALTLHGPSLEHRHTFLKKFREAQRQIMLEF